MTCANIFGNFDKNTKIYFSIRGHKIDTLTNKRGGQVSQISTLLRKLEYVVKKSTKGEERGQNPVNVVYECPLTSIFGQSTQLLFCLKQNGWCPSIPSTCKHCRDQNHLYREIKEKKPFISWQCIDPHISSTPQRPPDVKIP